MWNYRVIPRDQFSRVLHVTPAKLALTKTHDQLLWDQLSRDYLNCVWDQISHDQLQQVLLKSSWTRTTMAVYHLTWCYLNSTTWPLRSQCWSARMPAQSFSSGVASWYKEFGTVENFSYGLGTRLGTKALTLAHHQNCTCRIFLD